MSMHRNTLSFRWISRSALRCSIVMAVAGTLAACAPKLTAVPNLEAQLPAAVLLLPTQVESTVRQERVQFVEAQLLSELQNHGFQVVKAGADVCRDASCSIDPATLAARGITGTARLKLTTLSTNDFLAGFVNIVSGELRISDLQERELVKVEHTESERGGLLFHSGQLLQGVLSEVQNAGDDGFNTVATKFAEQLIGELPALPAASRPANEVVISRVNVVKVQPQVYRVCAQGAADAMAYLVVNQRKTNLRQTERGRFCGVYRLEGVMGDVLVEVRSALGSAARQSVRTFL